MSFLGKMGDMYKLQKQAREAKKKLQQTHIESEHGGVKVVVDGEMKVVSIEIVDKSLMQHEGRLTSAIKDSLNRAIEKAQKIAAEEMKGVMGDLGFPGM